MASHPEKRKFLQILHCRGLTRLKDKETQLAQLPLDGSNYYSTANYITSNTPGGQRDTARTRLDDIEGSGNYSTVY